MPGSHYQPCHPGPHLDKKYYDSSTQEADLSDIYADMRDEVGLIWATCVKVHISPSCLHGHPLY